MRTKKPAKVPTPNSDAILDFMLARMRDRNPDPVGIDRSLADNGLDSLDVLDLQMDLEQLVGAGDLPGDMMTGTVRQVATAVARFRSKV